MGQGNSNYNYVGSGTPDYYGNFSTNLKTGAKAVYGWSDFFEEGIIGATTLMPWLAPVTVPLGIAVGSVSMGAHVAEGLMNLTDGIVSGLDLRGTINGTIERDKYPDRYQYGNQSLNNIEKASIKVGGVNFNNNTFKDQLSEKASSSTDRYGNAVSSAFNQYKALTTI